MKRGALSWYVRLVVAGGFAIIVHSGALLLGSPHPREWILFSLLAILTGSFTIKVASIEASISVADTFFISSAMLFGPVPATVALAIDTLILSWRKKHAGLRVAFNIAAPALSLWVAAHTFFMLAHVPPLSVGRAPMGAIITPLLCLTLIYFGLNSGLIAMAVALEAKKSPIAIWREHFMWLGLGYFAAASLGLCLTFIIQQLGLGAIAVILPVVIVFHLTLRASFGRLEDAHRHVTQVDRLYTSTVETLAMAIDAKDDVTHNHVRRVQAYAKALARELGIADEMNLKAIEAAALLHDTGKLAVPEHILNKPGGLTPSEFEQMKRHVDVGADILSLVDFPYPVVPIVRCHHENWDGTGYPAGVKGEDIPIGARILSVVDCFDALTSDRPYRRALSDEAAFEILMDRRGRMYDPVVVDTFAKIYRDVEVTNPAGTTERHVMLQISRPQAAEAPEAPVEQPAQAPPLGNDVLAFVSLARLASGAVTVPDVLALSTNLLEPLLPGASGAWFMVRETGDRLSVVESFGPAAGALKGFSVAVGERLTGWVASNRQTIVNSDAALDLAGLAPQIDPALKSCLSVPMHVGHKLVGVLSLYSPERVGFDENQGRFVEMIVSHVAQALDAAAQKAAAPAAPAVSRDFKIVARH